LVTPLVGDASVERRLVCLSDLDAEPKQIVDPCPRSAVSTAVLVIGEFAVPSWVGAVAGEVADSHDATAIQITTAPQVSADLTVSAEPTSLPWRPADASVCVRWRSDGCPVAASIARADAGSPPGALICSASATAS